MAITVVTDLLDPSCNSYISLADVLDYIQFRMADEVLLDQWNDLDAAKQIAYVVNATRAIDSMVEWGGERYSPDQNLRWPRYNIIYDGLYIDPPDLPKAVVEATCEVVLWMMANDGATSVGQTQQYQAIRVGPIRIDMNNGAGLAAEKFLPDSVAIILSGLGTVKSPDVPGNKTVKIARLIRA